MVTLVVLEDLRYLRLNQPWGYPTSPGSDRLPERAKTWHEFGSERTSVQASREAAHSEPTKIRPTYPFPSLHLIQQGATSGDESDEDDFWDRSKEKLVWVDALNKWIPEQQLHHRPYLSFVGNPPTVEKQGLPNASRESQRRWQSAPSSRSRVSFMPLAYTKELSFCSVTNDNKREEIRRRAQEIAEQRRQRKAYSTPLYTSLTERKQKARIRSSKAPASTPVSPVQKTVKAPLPKEVWQPRDTPKTAVEEKPAPVKKEISITLLSSKTEDVESKSSGDVRSTPRDKHVKFQQDQANKAAKDKKGKKKTEDDENQNNSARSDSAAAERKLVEALEKQRQQQLAEEQRLLQEQQREKERLARERETQAEKERLEKERERLLELEKDPKKHGLMNSHKQPHENYYESTMNAAGGRRRKGKGDGTKSQKKRGAKVKKKSDDEEEEKHQEKLQVSSADDLVLEPTEQKPKIQIQVKQQPEENNKPDENELTYERRKSISQRVKEISLKEKRERPCVKKESKEKEETLPPPPDTKRVESWIFDDEDFSEKVQLNQEEEDTTDLVPLSISADLTPELVIEEKKQTKEKRHKSVIDQKIKTENKGKKWGKPKKDTSYDDELRRQELAEERRRRQMEMFERLKGRQMEQFDGQDDDGSPHFEDYGFLSKYCIFTKGNIEMYRHAFDAVDDEHRGWLEGEEVMIALRGVNSKLTEAEEEYMYRILELTGYKLTNGADFKMFSVLAALSQRISALDSWMRNLIGKMDFKMLDMKLFMCKTLWECNVDPDTNKISIDQLCVDLRAGGVSLEHEFEVREKLAHLDAIDLLDFLTYIPLFIMIHESVVENPLSDIREK